MLSQEVMGWLALGILWINTLLIVAATSARASGVARRLSQLRLLPSGQAGTGVALLELTGATRGDGVVAAWCLQQVGRFATHKGPRILFNDMHRTSECHGGMARWGTRSITLPAALTCEVWPDVEQVRRAAQCPDAETFDVAFPVSKQARAFQRTVRVPLRVGDRVWVAGVFVEDAGGVSVESLPDAPVVVAQVDPARWCRGRLFALYGAQLGIILGAAACTALAASPPLWGTVSTLGGVLCLAFFVLVQPLGTRLRDFAKLPHERVVRGEWRRPA